MSPTQAVQSTTGADPLEENEESYPWFRRVSEVVLMVAIGATVLYFQIKNRPTQADIYYTTDPWDTRRGGLEYFCGCSLPASLQNTQNPPLKNLSLNVCYDFSTLETVTVLMYSNSAAPILEPMITSYSSTDLMKKTVEGGYNVSQEAHDLSGMINSQSPHPFDGLQKLYVGGYLQGNILIPIQVLQSPYFMDFPMSYVRFVLVYTCSNCTSCGLEEVNKIAKRVVANEEVWANCFYWGDDDKCTSSKTYQAKCLLYPTQALPGSFVVKRCLEGLLRLPLKTDVADGYQANGFIADRSVAADGFGESAQSGVALLQPSFLYMNISQAVKSLVQFVFVEVLKGSGLWVSLLNKFPNLDTECAHLKPVKVCKGTSVCNMFATDTGSYDLRCKDMTKQSFCRQLMQNSSMDNMPNQSERIALECQPFTCQQVDPYYVIWNTPPKMVDDALNRFLATRKLNDDWAQRSGLCTNTYRNVIRHPPAVPGKPRTGNMLLMTNCAGTSNQTYTYCWLTGYYHNITDSPGARRTRIDHHLMSVVDRQFVCYRVKKQAFFPWFITTFGVLFGWLGTVELILKFCFSPRLLALVTALGTKVFKLKESASSAAENVSRRVYRKRSTKLSASNASDLSASNASELGPSNAPGGVSRRKSRSSSGRLASREPASHGDQV